MSLQHATNGERLARIETLLDDKVIPALDTLVHKVDTDIADLAKLKHRGAGLLIGVGIIFTAFGAFLRPQIESLMAFIK